MYKNLSSVKTQQGFLYGLIAFAMWGVLPIYWKALDHINSDIILWHRIIWSAFFLTIALIITRRFKGTILMLKDRRIFLTISASALVIGFNWFLFIWAINNGRVLETSMGYFLYPLLSAAIGIVVLRERLGVFQKIALTLAALGVVVVATTSADTSWISFGLAISFATYGYLRKTTPIPELEGLLVETLILSVIALYGIFSQDSSSLKIMLSDTKTITLLIGSGVVTALPMALFVLAARRLSMVGVGMLFYIAPTLMFLIAIFIYEEYASWYKILSFILIWSAVVFYSFGTIRITKMKINNA